MRYNDLIQFERVRSGFKKAWQERGYATIIAVALKIPENVVQKEPERLMWYGLGAYEYGGIDTHEYAGNRYCSVSTLV